MSLHTIRTAGCCMATALALACASASAQPPCDRFVTPPTTPSPAGSVLQLIADVPTGTKWESLPARTRALLRQAADARLAWFRSEWDRAALERKEGVLLACPTPKMLASIDRHLSEHLPNGAGFSIGAVTDPLLRHALVRLYLANFAAFRAGISYPTRAIPNLDWDGASRFASFPLPDAVAYRDIRAYAAEVVDDLLSVPEADLSVQEREWKQMAAMKARDVRAGAFLTNIGGQDWELPCQVSGAGGVLARSYEKDKGLREIFRDDEEVIAEFNAMYMPAIPMKWVDVGTLASARHSGSCHQGIESDIAEWVEPHSAAVAKAMNLLWSWWSERAGEEVAPFTPYSEADREAVWDAFTAGQLVADRVDASMATFAGAVESFRQQRVDSYRQLAATAVALVFPDDRVLTPAQRKGVLREIASVEKYGRFNETIVTLLDRAQGTRNSPAARVWRAAWASNVQQIGGTQADGELRPSDVAKAQAMFEEVRAWLVLRYPNYPQSIPEALSKVKISFHTGANAYADHFGAIQYGLGIRRSHLEVYSLLLHELRHAVRAATLATASAPAGIQTDDGFAAEGSGVAAEDMLRVQLLSDKLRNPLAVVLYQLDFAIRDARFVATTEAVLSRYARSQCTTPSCPTSIEAATAIAHRHGLTGPLAATLVERSHVGTQYLQYIFAGERVKSMLQQLSREIGTQRPIDPFMLFGCNLNNPRSSAEYVGKLKACLHVAERL